MSTATRRRGRFHELEVTEVRTLTSESIEVTFAVPHELRDDFQYLAGQYVALRAHVEGHEVRRSYSICRPPTPDRISVGIKRDLGGLFSVWAHENLKPGDRIDVMSPEGRFTTNLPDLDHAHIAGIAAGSGVTPDRQQDRTASAAAPPP